MNKERKASFLLNHQNHQAREIFISGGKTDMKNKMNALILLLLMAGLLLAGCDLVSTEPEPQVVVEPVVSSGVIAEANLMPAKYVALRFAMPGAVAEVAVDVGSEVEEGQVLARLQNTEAIEAQLLAADLAVMEAEQRLEEVERYRTDEDVLDLANAALDLAKGQQRAAKQALEETKLKAPFAGTVVRIDLKEGAYTLPAEVAMVLADFSFWYLETNDLNENEVVKISEGDQVEIIFDALPGESFTGEVESISEYFLERFGNITYLVRIRFNETDERLRWGMTAEVKFPQR
jgi:RND family efflux transporter MFP subunit